MKYLTTNLIAFILVHTTIYALQPEDLHGEWVSTSLINSGEDINMTETKFILFYKDNTSYSESFASFNLTKNDVRIWSVGGPEKATWKIIGKELRIQTTKMTIEFFSSIHKELDRKTTDKSIAEIYKEPTIYTLVSQKKGKLVFKEKEMGGTVTFTRPAKHNKKTPKWSKPLSSYPAEQLGIPPVFDKPKKHDPTGERFRRMTKMLLDHEGFKFSPLLPTTAHRKNLSNLRPKKEIAARIFCNFLCWAYVYQTEKQLPQKAIKKYIALHQLDHHLTKKEKQILTSNRAAAQEKFGSTIGWKLENTWALAWVLGFEINIDIDQEPFGDSVAPALLKFMNALAKDPNNFLKNCKIKPLAEVVQMEDIFYCTHNAVRSAQLRKTGTVPKGFHPVLRGGIIHEKRHALTWVLSPNVDWDDTDLST